MTNDMNWKIWFKKLCKGLGLTILATSCIFIADSLNATTFPVQYAFWASLAYTGFSQVGNWIKHTYLV